MLRKITTGLAVATFAGYWVDRLFYYSTATRNVRALWCGLVVGVDYKLNFVKEKAEDIEKLHYRYTKSFLPLWALCQSLQVWSGLAVLAPSMIFARFGLWTWGIQPSPFHFPSDATPWCIQPTPFFHFFFGLGPSRLQILQFWPQFCESLDSPFLLLFPLLIEWILDQQPNKSIAVNHLLIFLCSSFGALFSASCSSSFRVPNFFFS